VLPVDGLIGDVTRHGARYRSGVKHEGTRTVMVTAGLGACGAAPDLCLLTLVPAR